MFDHVHGLLFFDDGIVGKLIAGDPAALLDEADDALGVGVCLGDLVEGLLCEILSVHVRHSDYWGFNPYRCSNGRVFLAVVHSIGQLPDSEMQEIGMFEELPENLTYPLTSPVLYREAEKVLRSLVRFELATEGDGQTIIELRKQIWATTYRGFYPDSMIDDFDYGWHLEKELQRIRSPEYRVYRIVKDDQNIGYLSMRKTDGVLLQSLYILKEYQRQGIGQLAFDLVAQYCTEEGADSFTCHCLPENWNARAFYEKMGGRVVGADMDHEESWMNSVIYRFEVRQQG